MRLEQKIIPFSDVAAWRAAMRNAGKKVVATNGCFDLLHAGHVRYLHEARRRGDALIVGLNSDSSVRSLKGPARPINPEQDRAYVLAGLEAVDAVTIFPETRATTLLAVIQPDVYVKGGDYSVDQLPLEEREIVAKFGGSIEILPVAPGRSTTAIIMRMNDPAGDS